MFFFRVFDIGEGVFFVPVFFERQGRVHRKLFSDNTYYSDHYNMILYRSNYQEFIRNKNNCQEKKRGKTGKNEKTSVSLKIEAAPKPTGFLNRPDPPL
jgi:hypothetical protein